MRTIAELIEVFDKQYLQTRINDCPECFTNMTHPYTVTPYSHSVCKTDTRKHHYMLRALLRLKASKIVTDPEFELLVKNYSREMYEGYFPKNKNLDILCESDIDSESDRDSESDIDSDSDRVSSKPLAIRLLESQMMACLRD